METGIIRVPAVFVYGADRTEAADELFMGWAVGILGEDGAWADVVTHYGYRGKVKKEAICLCSSKSLRQRDADGQMLFTAAPFTDVMAAPFVRSEILCMLHRGSFLTAAEEAENGYRRILLADGRTGYVPCISCMPRRDSDGYLYTDEDGREDYFLRQDVRRDGFEQECRKSLVFHAKQYLRTPYRWAGKSAAGIDCSGFVFMCYLMSGILIYRDAKQQSGYPVRTIPADRMKPGDLLYFPGHVAMYLGHGKYIHATGAADSFGCTVNSLLEGDGDYRADLAESFMAAGSIWREE